MAALDRQARETLDQQWAAMMGYLRVGKQKEVVWYYDSEDPDEAANVRRLRRFYMLADQSGRVLQVSDAYRNIGVDSPSQISSRVREALNSSVASRAFWVKRNAFLIRGGIVFDQDRQSAYYVAIATPLARDHRILRERD
jgi:hypothetical protein